MTKINALHLLRHLTQVLDVQWEAPDDLIKAAQAVIDGCNSSMMYDSIERKNRLFALVNSKLKLNKERFQTFLDCAAKRRVFLNYHDKSELMDCLNRGDDDQFKRWLHSRGYDSSFVEFFNPITHQETLELLHEQLKTGFVIRKDARACSIDERKNEVMRSLFGSYVFNSFSLHTMHSYFNDDCRIKYLPDFYHHLLEFHPKALHRDCAMVFLCVDDLLHRNIPFEQLRDELCGFIRDTYDRLANHCFLAIMIRPLRDGDQNGQWRLFSDLVLYAEKHREVILKKGYFHPEKIEKATTTHIPELDQKQTKFETANEGFFFRDCLILADDSDKTGLNRTSFNDVDLLLLFDKNERDETIIPCPACRTKNVVGNSYPALGVRSWECQNPICPDRSAFDRGSRYSLSAIIKQEAIRSDYDLIPDSSLKKWKLDVVYGTDQKDVTDMLIRHFSLHGDTVVYVNSQNIGERQHGRRIIYENFRCGSSNSGVFQSFQNSAYFKRFVVERKEPLSASVSCVTNSKENAKIYQGDCFEVLALIKPDSIDNAVTSPPYYNARSYTQWPNIYCYLYDMYNSARQVFRVLKPGGIYLFNIFDYFDNENNIAFSTMGKKRMILGAYIVNIFLRVGFQISGNVIWYKGEIEGKRNYNQGNRSPYYQFPFNCWEHVFVFKKPGKSEHKLKFPKILDTKPVIKMIRGQNILGHTAPFPPAIPQLLLSQMNPNECVLDPFSGSMTTGRTAYRRGIKSVSIELHQEYCELGLRLLEEDIKNGLSD